MRGPTFCRNSGFSMMHMMVHRIPPIVGRGFLDGINFVFTFFIFLL